mmetsp:Transcript_1253/g.3623  ORF Transcript_1253/g.3623 Transcript_1253/m.3623 type:complete len:239 (-) Transcript_1253:211-927(-)
MHWVAEEYVNGPRANQHSNHRETLSHLSRSVTPSVSFELLGVALVLALFGALHHVLGDDTVDAFPSFLRLRREAIANNVRDRLHQPRADKVVVRLLQVEVGVRSTDTLQHLDEPVHVVLFQQRNHLRHRSDHARRVLVEGLRLVQLLVGRFETLGELEECRGIWIDLEDLLEEELSCNFIVIATNGLDLSPAFDNERHVCYLRFEVGLLWWCLCWMCASFQLEEKNAAIFDFMRGVRL